MAAAVWNKLTTRLSNWFGDEKHRNAQLRPSRSLTALNQKNLRVTVRTSKSTENLLKITTPSKKASTATSLTKKSSTKDILKLSLKKKKDDEILHQNHINNTNQNHFQNNHHQNHEESSSSKTFPMSFSWHSHITDILHPNNQHHSTTMAPTDMIAGPSTAATTMPSTTNNCIEVGPDGRIIDGTTLDATTAATSSNSKPKRSKSITAINSEEYCVRSDSMTRSSHGHGFRTPQSLSGYKCKQTIDPRFWRYSREHSVTNTDAMFKRLEKIGEGSYATVLKGENRIDGSIVALKEIKLQPQEGLPFTAIREVSLLRGLKHANIVRLHQIVHQPHSLILVFEYVKTDLSKFMENYRNGLDAFRTKIFLFQLLRGLAFCHDRKILHRDLKPQNLLVAENNELKLADFGLARAKSVPCRTFSHDVVTLWYRPPDVLLGSTHYSTSLDMWGVGCIFAEMLTGIPLFPGINDAKDQLERIFAIRGVPNVQKWPEVTSLPNYKLFHFQAYTEMPWRRVHHVFSRLPEGGEKLLNSFLQLNPIERISANAAMLHTYFSALPPEVHLLKPTESIFSVLPDASSSSSSFSR